MMSAESELASTAKAALPEKSVLSRLSFIPAPLLAHLWWDFTRKEFAMTGSPSVVGAAMRQEWGHISRPITQQILSVWSSTDVPMLSHALALPKPSTLAPPLPASASCLLLSTADLPYGRQGWGCKLASSWAFFSAGNIVPETSCRYAAPEPLFWGDLNYIASLRCASAV